MSNDVGLPCIRRFPRRSSCHRGLSGPKRLKVEGLNAFRRGATIDSMNGVTKVWPPWRCWQPRPSRASPGSSGAGAVRLVPAHDQSDAAERAHDRLALRRGPVLQSIVADNLGASSDRRPTVDDSRCAAHRGVDRITPAFTPTRRQLELNPSLDPFAPCRWRCAPSSSAARRHGKKSIASITTAPVSLGGLAFRQCLGRRAVTIQRFSDLVVKAGAATPAAASGRCD